MHGSIHAPIQQALLLTWWDKFLSWYILSLNKVGFSLHILCMFFYSFVVFFSLICINSSYVKISHFSVIWIVHLFPSLWLALALFMVGFCCAEIFALCCIWALRVFRTASLLQDHWLFLMVSSGSLCGVLTIDSELGLQAHCRVQATGVVGRLCQLQPCHPLHEEAAGGGCHCLRGVHHQQVLSGVIYLSWGTSCTSCSVGLLIMNSFCLWIWKSLYFIFIYERYFAGYRIVGGSYMKVCVYFWIMSVVCLNSPDIFCSAYSSIHAISAFHFRHGSFHLWKLGLGLIF